MVGSLFNVKDTLLPGANEATHTMEVVQGVLVCLPFGATFDERLEQDGFV